MEKKEIEYRDGSHVLQATFYSKEPQKKRPAIILIHAWQGKNSYVCMRAEQVAQMGYHAFAIDVYGKGILASSPQECAALMDPFMKDREKLRQRLLAGVHLVKEQSYVEKNKMAVIGFCFGGLCALDIARSGEKIAGVVSFHGLLRAPQIPQEKDIHCPILIMHGDLDPMVPSAEFEAFQQEMRDKKANWEAIIYGNTYHAFTNPDANNKKKWNCLQFSRGKTIVSKTQIFPRRCANLKKNLDIE